MKNISILFLLASGLAMTASAGVTQYNSRAAFLAATTGTTTIDFGVAVPPPPNSFNTYPVPPGLNISGVNFSTTTGTDPVYVNSRSFCCITYARGYDQLTTGAIPMKITLPAGITAVAFDLFSAQANFDSGTNQDNVDVNIGGAVYHFKTLPAPQTFFVGFTSTSPIGSLTVTTTQSSPVLRSQAEIMNFSFGSGAATPAPPFGVVDTPANNSTNLTGAVGVTGWALSSATLASVGIWREPVSGEAAGLVLLGTATQVPGARPDVANAYPNYPQNNYGWGAQILTNELPGMNGQPVGNGTYKLHIIATDSQGGSTDLAGPVTITANNASAVLPFGTIDTPAQGGTVSGSAFVNFGWALTPNSANVIPKDGSTITVFIDNQPVGHPTYDNFRNDVATLFPGLQNSNGAVGFFIFDSTKLVNGLHTIAWVAADNVGHAQGLGSRFFIVQNP